MTQPAEAPTVPQDGNVGSLFRAGRLAEAIDAANVAVRKRPTDVANRILLAELLLFSGNLERADTLLDAAGDIDPMAAVAIAEFRQLVRGEMARRQLFRDGRMPEFLDGPTAAQRHALAALVAVRDGDSAGAAALAAEAEAARVHPSGEAPSGPFDDLRDADDIMGGTFEVLTTTGKYFWIPMERVVTATFHPPKRPRDLYWRRVTMEVANGPEGDVYIPAIYPHSAEDEAQRLGRATDWHQDADGPVRGMGGVTVLLGDDAVTLMELERLTVQAAA